MPAEQNLERLREAFQAELRKHWGHIGTIEARLEKSEGYLGKFSKGSFGMPLEVFFRCLDEMDVDAGAFFARAFDSPAHLDDALLELADQQSRNRAWEKIERAFFASLGLQAPDRETLDRESLDAESLDAAGATATPTAPQTASATADLIDKLMACTITEQRRRLRHTKRYRNIDFALAYVERLDALRNEDPKATIKLAATLLIDFVPQLACSKRQRLALQCRAIGVYSSAQRVRAQTGVAARALHLALRYARELRESLLIADLLRRANLVLRYHNRTQEALLFLREAQQIYSDAGDESRVAQVIYERAMNHFFREEFHTAIELHETALKRFQQQPDIESRWLMAAHVSISRCYQELQETEQAEAWLGKALAGNFEISPLDRSSIEWQQGTFAAKRGDYALAETLLSRAAAVRAEKVNAAEGAIASLTLIDVIFAQGRFEEACEKAKELAQVLGMFRHLPLAEAAIVLLLRSAVDATLTRELIQHVSQQIQKAAANDRPKPSQSR